jgi:hypothetical protein
LLAKETINLIDINRILGERPFPMKESLKEYLVELQERKDNEDEQGKKAEEGAAPTPTGTTATGEASSEDLKKGKVAQHGSNIPVPEDIENQQDQQLKP